MEIILTGKLGGVAIVSAEDYDKLSKYKWHMDADGYIRSTINRNTIKMHRYILNVSNPNVIVDHINKIRHDNRRENIRLSNGSKNAQNRSIGKNKKSSKYRGVTYHTSMKKYRARLILNKKSIYMGLFKNEIDAAKAVDMYLVHNKGFDHIPLNFPQKREKYLKKTFKPYQSKKINKTIYRGLTKRKNGRCDVTIRINKKDIRIGSSHDLSEAAKMWDMYVVDNNIPHRKLNFPDDYPDYEPKIIKTKCEPINDDDTVRLLLDQYPNDFIIIDKEDYDRVKYYMWSFAKGYVCGYINGKNIRIHRFLTNTTNDDIIIDHIDNNKLNNKKENLRISDSGKNARNKKKKQNTKYKYFGVSFDDNNWKSSVNFCGIYIWIGYRDSEIHAARARDLYIMQYLKDEHYKLNFKWTDDDIIKWEKRIDTSEFPPLTEVMGNSLAKDTKNIINALIDDDLMLLHRLNMIYNKKMKTAKEIFKI